jgi:hypothetical protein
MMATKGNIPTIRKNSTGNTYIFWKNSSTGNTSIPHENRTEQLLAFLPHVNRMVVILLYENKTVVILPHENRTEQQLASAHSPASETPTA